MRLADFIEENAVAIVDGAETFAATQASGTVHMDSESLRDHIAEILAAVVLDLRTAQNSSQQQAKSEGTGGVVNDAKSAASAHGRLRAKHGFNIDQMVAEYRALRAAVLRLWAADKALTGGSVEDMIRFNEAIDQAVAESVANFSAEAEAWRNLFLGVIGHDLRAPLGVIVSTSEVMSLMTQDSPFSEHAKRIIRSGRRMSKLLDDLLDFSRTSLGMGIRVARKDSDLLEGLTEEIELLRAALPDKNIIFEAFGPAKGSFDVSRIREAISNLIINAAKYGSMGPISVTVSGDAEHVELVVRNEGVTLSSSDLNALFEPLSRGPTAATASEHSSMGLGLFIVREIAKAHGGRVTANATGGSTAFTMRIPKASQELG